MTIEQELRLSYYRPIANLDGKNHVFLVQDTRDTQLYVKKVLKVYNKEIYQHVLDNPIAHVPQILLLEEDEDGLTVIEEYIHGKTLAQILEQDGVLTQKEALSIAIQLCAILKDFHNCSPAIINRDVTPSNIKITPDGIVKLVDINAAKWQDDTKAKDTVLLGTKGYAAPEQYGFAPSNQWTDIYAVGVLINVMLTGQLPNQTIAEGKLSTVIHRCVSLTPSERYGSMAVLLKELIKLSRWQRYLPPGYRSAKPVRWVLASIMYVTFVPASITMFLNKEHFWGSLTSGLLFALTLFAVVLFNGNYLNVQDTFYFTRCRNPMIRWLGIMIVDFTLLFAWAHLDQYVMTLLR